MDLHGSLRIFTDLPEERHLLQFGTSSPRAGGQDDVSSNKLPRTMLSIHVGIEIADHFRAIV